MVAVRLSRVMSIGVLKAAVAPITDKAAVGAFTVAIDPLVVLIVPGLTTATALLATKARWLLSGVMSKSPKVTLPVLFVKLTPIPPDAATVVLLKFTPVTPAPKVVIEIPIPVGF